MTDRLELKMKILVGSSVFVIHILTTQHIINKVLQKLPKANHLANFL